MSDPAALYAETRQRMIDLARGLGEAASADVPACPGWTVKDVYAHVTGVCHDILTGNLEGVATDPWTAVHVDSRRGAGLDQVLDEWGEKGAQVEAMIPAFPEFAARQLAFDLVTHDHDVRGALARPGAKDDEAVMNGLDFAVGGLDQSVRAKGLPALRLRAGGREWTVGEGEARATVGADPFELMRALTGRRSAGQIRAWAWQGDPEPYLPAFQFGPFTTRDSDLVE